jgi:hypothetical protein
MKMKTTKWITGGFSALLLMSLTVSSCKKTTNTSPTSEETTSSADNSLAEHTVSDMTEMAAQSSDGSSGLSSYRLAPGYDAILGLGCATVTYDTINKIVTLTFSASSTCLDGKTRSGQIIINYSGSAVGARHYRDPGFSCSVTTNHYVVDGNQVNIVNKVITNTTPVGFNPASTNETWSINADVSIVKSSGGTFTWNCNRTKTLLNTSDTSIYHGAARPITWSRARVGQMGSANGNTAAGTAFTASITNQLIRDFGGCNISGQRPFIQGTIQFTPSGHPTRTIDYGNGTCDLIYTVTVNGVTYTFTLP